jgi:hypothetical protein
MRTIILRVKFLPLAWAGMPKTSFRKNSDSPLVILVGGTSNIIPFRRTFFFLIQLVVALI